MRSSNFPIPIDDSFESLLLDVVLYQATSSINLTFKMKSVLKDVWVEVCILDLVDPLYSHSIFKYAKFKMVLYYFSKIIPFLPISENHNIPFWNIIRGQCGYFVDIPRIKFGRGLLWFI